MKKKPNRIYAKDYISWWGYAIVQFSCCAIPSKLVYFFADRLGDIMFKFSKKTRRMIGNNLRMALGLKDGLIKKYTRIICRGFYRNIVDFLRFRKFDEKWFREEAEIIGTENLKKAFGLGRGVIAISLHMGSWETGALMTAMAGFPANGIWASHANPKVEEFFLRQRIERGIKVILTGGAMKKTLYALKANELVFFVMDHSYSKKGVEVDFFGRKTILPKGAATAAIKTGAAIMPVVATRGKDMKHELICGEIVEYSVSGDDEKDIHDITEKCAKTIEKFVRKYPDQWLLFRRCWDK